MGVRLGKHPGYWVYYGIENVDLESSVANFVAFSELIDQLNFRND
jgi:hypothetical protein